MIVIGPVFVGPEPCQGRQDKCFPTPQRTLAQGEAGEADTPKAYFPKIV